MPRAATVDRIRPDGSRYRVHGFVWDGSEIRCPTERCDTFCCKTGSLFPGASPPCQFLVGSKCWFQTRGGLAAKPYGCVSYPTSQTDVDSMNAKKAAGQVGCLLTVEEVDGN